MAFILGSFLGALIDPIKLVLCIFLAAVIPNLTVAMIVAILLNLGFYFYIAISPNPVIALIQVIATVIMVLVARKAIKSLKRIGSD